MIYRACPDDCDYVYDYDYDRKVYHIDFPFTSHGRKPSQYSACETKSQDRTPNDPAKPHIIRILLGQSRSA